MYKFAVTLSRSGQFYLVISALFEIRSKVGTETE